MFQGLEHTAIASPDPRGLAEWYTTFLGFRINYEYEGNYFVKAPDGTMIEIIPSQGERQAAGMKQPGIRHMAIAVVDFDAAHAHIRELGVNFLTAPFETQGNRLVFFEDRDGNVLHLIQRKTPLA